MQLPRHTLRSDVPQPAFTSASFCEQLPSTRGPALAACVTPSGFLVADFPTLRVVTRRVFREGACGLASATPIAQTPLVLLQSEDDAGLFARNKIVLWDDDEPDVRSAHPTTVFSFDAVDESDPRVDASSPSVGGDADVSVEGASRGRVVAELVFATPVYGVRAVRISGRDSVVLAVVLATQTIVLQLSDEAGQGCAIRERAAFETAENRAGIVSLGAAGGLDAVLLAVPGLTAGQVQVALLSLDDASGANASTVLIASQSPIATLQLWHAGGLLATASQRGTLIRVWQISARRQHDQARVQYSLDVRPAYELRRGTSPADVYDLAFSTDGKCLASISDTGTVHIFDCASALSAPPSPGSALHESPRNAPQTRRSTAQFRVPLHKYPYTVPDADVAVNRDGSWARARTRLADIRAQHAPISERVRLAWIENRLAVLTTAGVCYVLSLAGRDMPRKSPLPHLSYALHGCALAEFHGLPIGDLD